MNKQGGEYTASYNSKTNILTIALDGKTASTSLDLVPKNMDSDCLLQEERLCNGVSYLLNVLS